MCQEPNAMSSRPLSSPLSLSSKFQANSTACGKWAKRSCSHLQLLSYRLLVLQNFPWWILILMIWIFSSTESCRLPANLLMSHIQYMVIFLSPFNFLKDLFYMRNVWPACMYFVHLMCPEACRGQKWAPIPRNWSFWTIHPPLHLCFISPLSSFPSIDFRKESWIPSLPTQFLIAWNFAFTPLSLIGVWDFVCAHV